MASKPILSKNRVGFNVYKGLSEFWAKFLPEKSPAQFAFGFGSAEPRLDWAEIGGNRPKGLSRGKGMETPFDSAPTQTSFGPKGLSRGKGMETHYYLWNTLTTLSSERTFPFEGNGNS